MYSEHQSGRRLDMFHRTFVDTLSDPVEIFFNCKSYPTYLNIKSERTFYGIAKILHSGWTCMDDPN